MRSGMVSQKIFDVITQPRPTNFAIVQYDSCRGLEGWAVLNLSIDDFFDYKVASWEGLPHREGAAEAENTLLARRFATRWLMIPCSRAIDTLVLNVRSRTSYLGACTTRSLWSLWRFRRMGEGLGRRRDGELRCLEQRNSRVFRGWRCQGLSNLLERRFGCHRGNRCHLPRRTRSRVIRCTTSSRQCVTGAFYHFVILLALKILHRKRAISPAVWPCSGSWFLPLTRCRKKKGSTSPTTFYAYARFFNCRGISGDQKACLPELRNRFGRRGNKYVSDAGISGNSRAWSRSADLRSVCVLPSHFT